MTHVADSLPSEGVAVVVESSKRRRVSHDSVVLEFVPLNVDYDRRFIIGAAVFVCAVVSDAVMVAAARNVTVGESVNYLPSASRAQHVCSKETAFVSALRNGHLDRAGPARSAVDRPRRTRLSVFVELHFDVAQASLCDLLSCSLNAFAVRVKLTRSNLPGVSADDWSNAASSCYARLGNGDVQRHDSVVLAQSESERYTLQRSDGECVLRGAPIKHNVAVEGRCIDVEPFVARHDQENVYEVICAFERPSMAPQLAELREVPVMRVAKRCERYRFAVPSKAIFFHASQPERSHFVDLDSITVKTTMDRLSHAPAVCGLVSGMWAAQVPTDCVLDDLSTAERRFCNLRRRWHEPALQSGILGREPRNGLAAVDRLAVICSNDGRVQVDRDANFTRLRVLFAGTLTQEFFFVAFCITFEVACLSRRYGVLSQVLGILSGPTPQLLLFTPPNGYRWYVGLFLSLNPRDTEYRARLGDWILTRAMNHDAFDYSLRLVRQPLLGPFEQLLRTVIAPLDQLGLLIVDQRCQEFSILLSQPSIDVDRLFCAGMPVRCARLPGNRILLAPAKSMQIARGLRRLFVRSGPFAQGGVEVVRCQVRSELDRLFAAQIDVTLSREEHRFAVVLVSTAVERDHLLRVLLSSTVEPDRVLWFVIDDPASQAVVLSRQRVALCHALFVPYAHSITQEAFLVNVSHLTSSFFSASFSSESSATRSTVLLSFCGDDDLRHVVFGDRNVYDGVCGDYLFVGGIALIAPNGGASIVDDLFFACEGRSVSDRVPFLRATAGSQELLSQFHVIERNVNQSGAGIELVEFESHTKKLLRFHSKIPCSQESCVADIVPSSLASQPASCERPLFDVGVAADRIDSQGMSLRWAVDRRDERRRLHAGTDRGAGLLGLLNRLQFGDVSSTLYWQGSFDQSVVQRLRATVRTPQSCLTPYERSLAGAAQAPANANWFFSYDSCQVQTPLPHLLADTEQ
jgi:hypothetical protein